MSSFLCFICHNTVQNDTTTETREKYRELVGMKLCQDSHLCHICCHLLNKLWLFKSICLRRSMEYPVLFSDKGTINLQNSNTETTIVCTETEECNPHTDSSIYHYSFNELNQNSNHSNQYVSLEERLDENMYNLNDSIQETEENQQNDDLYNNYVEADNVIDDNNEFDATPIENAEDNEAISDNEQDNDDEQTEDANNDSTDTNDFHKVILTVEEQRAELEAKRREDKYLEAEFKCYNCALGFLFKDTYQAHMMRHEESNGEHLCPICTLRFASARVLRAHATSHRERATCVRCDRPVRPRRLAAHRARCGAGARAPCHLCGNTFADANGLQQHIKRFHLSKTSKKTYSCNICGKSYNNQGAVRTHMIFGTSYTFVNYFADACRFPHDVFFHRKAQSKHINKKFTCEQCPSTFSSPYTLAQHRKRHTNTEEHRCESCNVSYGSRKSLLAHMRNSLSHQQTVFTCPVCSRICARTALATHMQSHSAHKPHACTICPARYHTRKGLTGHVRRHAGTAPKAAVCHLCGASFKGNSKLNRHLRSVCEKAKLEEELSAYYNQE